MKRHVLGSGEILAMPNLIARNQLQYVPVHQNAGLQVCTSVDIASNYQGLGDIIRAIPPSRMSFLYL